MKRIGWVFNTWVLWGALFGCVIIHGVTTIQDARQHHGPGRVWYEDESSEYVPEAEYKRHECGMGIMMLSLGLLFWIQWARIARDDSAKAKADLEGLRAYADWLNAYRNALTDALDAATRERAVAAANSSAEVLDAQGSVPLAIRIHLPSYRGLG